MNKKGQIGAIIGISFALIFILLILLGVFGLVNSTYKGYKFNKEIGSYCSLSYSASDIDKKIQYFDKCYDKLVDERYTGYSVWWFTKPSNKATELYEVAKSLKNRMHNLKGMDKASFEYQKGLEQVEEEIDYFIDGDPEGWSSGLNKFKTLYCYRNTWTKYLC